MQRQFVHVVNFWLKKGLTPADIRQFEKGVRSLGQIRTLQLFHLGTPADTDRPVIDRSYDYCLVCVFSDKAAHDSYQVDPIHDRFREDCSPFWEKVLIYDSEEV